MTTMRQRTGKGNRKKELTKSPGLSGKQGKLGKSLFKAYKAFFMLNSAEHEIYPAYHCWYFNNYEHDKGLALAI